MKKLLVVIALLMVGMVYVSCSKDDDDNRENPVVNYKEMIAGTWSVSYADRIDRITFNGVNMYFEARCSLQTFNGEYSVVENVITLNEGKYGLDVILINSITESSFIGQCNKGEIKGTRINE